MILWLLVVTNLISLSIAAVDRIQFNIGPFTVHYIYNNVTYATDEIALVKFNRTTNEVWFQGVSASSTNKNIACRRASQERIIVGPVGCSNIATPSAALQSSNCIPNQVDVVERLAIFQDVWYLSKESNECFLGGGDGDPRLCMGPMRLALDNKDSFIPRDFSVWPTERDLLSSRMAFIDTLTGPFAMAPALFEVPLVLPALNVITDCPLYQQSYTSFAGDSYTASVGTVWKTFKGNQLRDLNILFMRSGGAEGTDFIVVFGTNTGTAGSYNLEYKTAVQSSSLNGELLITSNWIDLLQFNVSYSIYNYTSGILACTAIFNISSPSSRFLLQDIYPPTSSNYSWNLIPSRFWNLRVCNYHIGRLTHSNELFYDGCPAGDVCGGDVIYSYPAYPHLPVYVPPNPTLDFRLSCEEFYPKNESFLDYGQDGVNGRTLQNRMNVQQELCFAPFPLPSLIQLNINPDEKYRQCQYLGGFTWGSTQTMCAIGITQTYCKRGWYYANQNCYYKFNPTTEGKYAVPIDQASIACNNLNSFAKPLIEVDERLNAWLLDFYLYQNTDLNNVAQYRIPQFKSPKCTCFDSETLTKVTCDCYNIISATSLSIFPICYYPLSTSALEPQYAFIQVSLQSARLWTYGQEGPKSSGFQAECECNSGWTGKICERQTCPLEDIIEEAPADLNTLTTFFRKCYTEKHGSCWNGQPRVCQCDTGYAPPASIIPTFPELYQFRDYPCACPAAKTVESTYFLINTDLYQALSPNDSLVCSGTTQGGGVINNATNICECACATRTNILTGLTEDSFDGKACSCERPIQPWAGEAKNGRIIAQLCNNKGVCCPFGQSISNPYVGDFYDPRCFTDNGDPLSSCVCDNGWGGESCTCPVPFNYAFERFKTVQELGGEEYIYINLGGRYFINFVEFSGCNVPTLVRVTNDISTESSIDCSYNATSMFFECSSSLSHQYVVYQGSLECTVAAYQTLFQFCGANGTANIFAGRFYALPVYRGRFNNLLQQYTGIANYGCTNTECMCNTDWGGALCAAGVSSIRNTIITVNDVQETVQAKLYCGESVLVPRLTDPVAGRGSVDQIYKNCSCNSISNVDATGRVGKVTERFIGDACECATGYNLNYKEVLTCAGHGECEARSFPYGSCETDIANFESDALFTPYVEETSFTSEYTELVFTEDSFFYGYVDFPTQAPTKAPTNNPTLPTQSPTKAPTTAVPTNAPTQNPTLAPLILFSRTTRVFGNIGPRYTADALCAQAAIDQSLSCDTAAAFLSYNASDQILDFPTIYGFAPLSPVTSKTFVLLRSSWSSLIPTTGIDTTLFNSGVIPDSAYSWFSGTQTSGVVSSSTCNEWTDNTIGFSGTVGSSVSLGSAWLNTGGSVCSNEQYLVCLCVQSATLAPTKAPTTLSPTPPTLAPTRDPTQNPTPPTLSTPSPTTAAPTAPTTSPTKAPTANPTRNPTANPTLADLILFNGFSDTGNVGNRATTNARCLANVGSLSCTQVLAFLSYSGGDDVLSLPTAYSFSSARPVKSSAGDLIQSSYATMFSSESILLSLSAASVVSSVWSSGTIGAGTYSSLNCLDWTSSSAVEGLTVGSHTSTNFNWIGSSTERVCSQTTAFLCLCVK